MVLQKLTNTIPLKRLLSKFFYHFAKSLLASKIKTHASLIAPCYDFCAVIVSWFFACWIFIQTMANTPAVSYFITEIWSNNANSSSKSLLLVSFYWRSVVLCLLWILPLQILLFRLSGLYRGFWRFASIQDLRKILYVSLLGGLVAWAVLWARMTGILPESPLLESASLSYLSLLPPPTLSLLYSLFLIAFLAFARFFVRFAKDFKHIYGDYQQVIIVGAGNAGEGLVRDLLRDESQPYKPVAFVDDDIRKQGREIHNIRVRGTLKDLPKLIDEYGVDLVFIAIPSASSASMRSVVALCEKSKVRCYTLPSLKDLANGLVSINILRSISLEDLIGRYPVTCQLDSIKSSLDNKTILVTGGGGSIGAELCRQIASFGGHSQLVIVDSNEYNLYLIDMELRQRFPSYQFYPILLNVTDRVGIQSILKKYQPHWLFHAAAYKHVPLLEDQIRIAIYNNIIGTSILAEEASRAGVEKFVLISTDKAVNPTNIMGATKRAAEYYCQNLNYHALHTNFMTVRFGNVLDSAGSVVPLFRKQIEAGGPVTVTHPDITRYFMTIPEASQLILQAALLGEGGEIFVLDMGEPIKIRYLAEQMIKIAGKSLEADIKIIYTGLRPGEKLYEECFYPGESLQPTAHSKILRAQSQRRNFSEIQTICNQLAERCTFVETQFEDLLNLLKELVPEYQLSMDEINKNNGNIYAIDHSQEKLLTLTA